MRVCSACRVGGDAVRCSACETCCLSFFACQPASRPKLKPSVQLQTSVCHKQGCLGIISQVLVLVSLGCSIFGCILCAQIVAQGSLQSCR